MRGAKVNAGRRLLTSDGDTLESESSLDLKDTVTSAFGLAAIIGTRSTHSPTVQSGFKHRGSVINPFSYFLTFRTISAWASGVQLW